MRLEPFSLRDEVRGGILTKEGVYRMARERGEQHERQQDHEDYEREEDAWVRGLAKAGIDDKNDDDQSSMNREINDEIEEKDEQTAIDTQIKLLQLL